MNERPPSTPSKPLGEPVVVGLGGIKLFGVLLLTAISAAVAGYLWAVRAERLEHEAIEARAAERDRMLGARIDAFEARIDTHQHTAPPPTPVLAPPATRRGDPKRALLVVHAEWRGGVARASELGRTCPDQAPLLESEIEAVRAALKQRAISLDVAEQDRFAAMSDAAVATYGLVIHHNGGWGSALDPLVGAALLRAWAAGTTLLFAGDDTGMMLASAPEHLRLAGIAFVRDNGGYPVELQPAPARDPLPVRTPGVTDGELMRAMGVLAVPDRARAIQYEKEPDGVSLAPDALALALTQDRVPVAWLRDGPVGVGVYDLSMRASDVCPVSSDERWMRELFLLMVDLLLRAR